MITISTTDFQERGIRSARDGFFAVNGSNVQFFTRERNAMKWLAAQGYDSDGNKLWNLPALAAEARNHA